MSHFFEQPLRYTHWVVFFLLEALSGWLFFRFNAGPASVWNTQAGAVSGSVLETRARLVQYFHLTEVNTALSQQLVALEEENSALRTQLALALAVSDTSLLANGTLLANGNLLASGTLLANGSMVADTLPMPLAEKQLVAAHVVSNSIRRKDNYITIDRGLRQGVRREQGVVGGGGIVGITYLVSDNYALVLPVLNSRSSVSCRLRGSNYFGALKWEGDDPLVAYMEDIPLHAQCKEGDIVETSGFSRVFPAGILVGKATEVGYSSDGLSYRLRVALAADIARLRDVSVVVDNGREEVDALEKSVQR